MQADGAVWYGAMHVTRGPTCGSTLEEGGGSHTCVKPADCAWWYMEVWVC